MGDAGELTSFPSSPELVLAENSSLEFSESELLLSPNKQIKGDRHRQKDRKN